VHPRFNILKFYLTGSTPWVDVEDFLRKMIKPPMSWLGKKKVLKIKSTGQYLEVWLRGLDCPLFWPKYMPQRRLYQVIAEIMYPENWHYYEAFGTFVQGDDVVLDCGAAEGLLCLKVAPHSEHVYAVEPLPQFVEAMTKTFSGKANVTVCPIALSDEEGWSYIKDADIASRITMDERNSASRVRVSTIDKEFLNRDIRISYIKADLEGHEIKMLMGAKKTIMAHRPKIAITTYHCKSHVKEIEAYLRSIVPEYKITVKGIDDKFGCPIMLHAWVE